VSRATFETAARRSAEDRRLPRARIRGKSPAGQIEVTHDRVVDDHAPRAQPQRLIERAPPRRPMALTDGDFVHHLVRRARTKDHVAIAPGFVAVAAHMGEQGRKVAIDEQPDH